MLTIHPVQDKNEQRRLCNICDVPYRPGDFAYAAYVDGQFVGLSQFRVDDSRGYLDDLVSSPGTNDAEALFIMGRQTLNWIDLLGLHTCRARSDSAPRKLLHIMGFSEEENQDILTADMTHMFDGHCGGHCDIAKELHSES